MFHSEEYHPMLLPEGREDGEVFGGFQYEFHQKNLINNKWVGISLFSVLSSWSLVRKLFMDF